MLIIEWSFSLQFQHTHFQFTAAMWASQRHGLCMISSHICISQQCLYGFILLAWSPEAIKVSKQIAPWHYTKRKRGEISGSQTKRIPYRCHEVSQEHNCFWALICFSAATKGGKGVILVNVSVHRPFCTPCDGPTWNTREKGVHKRKGDNKLTSNTVSWKKTFHNQCVQLQTNTLVQLSVWVSSFLGKLGFHFATLH